MENNLFHQAKSAISRLHHTQNATSDEDKRMAREAIQQAYNQCSAEETQELDQYQREHHESS